jgi:hypothetical protein
VGLAGLNEFVSELRRRRVFRALAGWGIFSFAILQVVEPVLHAYHLPEWSLTAVVSVLAVGFPATVILAWVFDLTSRGVVRTDEPAVASNAAEVIARGAFGDAEARTRGLALLQEAPTTNEAMNFTLLWGPYGKAARGLPEFPEFLRRTGLAALWDRHGPGDGCRRVVPGDYRCD